MGAFRNNASIGRPYLDVSKTGAEHGGNSAYAQLGAAHAEGRRDGLTLAAGIVRTASSIDEAVRLIEEAMRGDPTTEFNEQYWAGLLGGRGLSDD